MPLRETFADLRGPIIGLLLSAVLVAAIAVTTPFTLAVFGILLLGPIHVLLAVRYMSGRISGAVTTVVGRLLVVLLALMVVVRAVTVSEAHLGHALELFGGAILVGFSLVVGLHGRWRLLAPIPIALAAIIWIVDLPAFWLVFTYAHNLIPLVFLWDWSRGHPAGRRLAFVAANLVWMLGVPVVILAGLVDPVLGAAAPGSVAALVDPAAVIAGATPSGAAPELGLRYLTTFAFLQTMHYVLWIVFFPLLGRAELRRSPLPRGWSFWALAAVVSLVVWAVYLVGYAEGRAVYGVLGSINLYLEQPVAVWLLLTALPVSVTGALVSRLRY